MYKLRIEVELDFDDSGMRDRSYDRAKNLIETTFPNAKKEGTIERWDEVEVNIPRVERQNRESEEIE